MNKTQSNMDRFMEDAAICAMSLAPTGLAGLLITSWLSGGSVYLGRSDVASRVETWLIVIMICSLPCTAYVINSVLRRNWAASDPQGDRREAMRSEPPQTPGIYAERLITVRRGRNKVTTLVMTKDGGKYRWGGGVDLTG